MTAATEPASPQTKSTSVSPTIPEPMTATFFMMSDHPFQKSAQCAVV